MTASAHSLELLKVAAAAADSKAGEDLVAIDVSTPLPSGRYLPHRDGALRAKRCCHRR